MQNRSIYPILKKYLLLVGGIVILVPQILSKVQFRP